MLGLWGSLRGLLGRKAVPLQSDLGRGLESPLDWSVNSGAFGRTQRFVNRQPEILKEQWFWKGAYVRLTTGS